VDNSQKIDPHTAAEQLLDLVGEVIRELHPNDTTFSAPTLDGTFDRDLSLDSLGRVELITRAERTFEVTLSERVMSAAETPRDILRELIKGAGGTALALSVETIDVSSAVATSAPDTAETLTGILRWHVEQHPERPHIQFYDDYTDGEIITYGSLWEGAAAVAGGLQFHGLKPGEAVALMLPTGRDYFFAFYAVVLAGGIPVPIYPPVRRAQLEDHLRRQSAILTNCQASMLITVADAKSVARLLTSQVDSLHHVGTVEELTELGRSCEVVARRADDIGFLQYTSGSTGNPKGVVLSHANLLANIRADGYGLQVKSSDVFVSWLPLYHDMGLIGGWLGSIYHAPRLVIMSPLSFLSRPQRWLWAIHRYGGTISAAPNFAYDLCVRRIDEKDIEGIDLSRWRVVANGAEAISPTTMRAFCDRFAAHGFKRAAMFPVYGLAECSVGLTFSPIGRGPLIDTIDRDILARDGRAEPALPTTEESKRLEVVSCGLPLPRHEIRVVDGAGREFPERREGHLQFRGPSATSGYYRNPEKTAELIRDGWLETGDLAYIAAGELFITGRSKDLIIRAGRNIYPAELEGLIGDLDGIRAGCVAVFGSPDLVSGTERLVVLAETRKQDPEARERLRIAINEIATDVVTAPPDDVVLVSPNTVLKTSSGKIRRVASRERYEQGLLDQSKSAVWIQIVRLALAGIAPQLRRGFRFVKESFFALYAWGVFSAVGICAWVLAMLPLPRSLLWSSLGGLTRTLSWLTACPIVVKGQMPEVGHRFVIVSNHQSYLDGPLLLLLIPYPVEFLVKGEFKDSWLLRRPFSRLGVRFVERFDGAQGVAQMQEAAEAVGDSVPLMIFPEGTFKRMPGLLPFHMGAFTTSAAADVRLVPIAIHGTRSILRAHSWYPRAGKITVTIGEPVLPDHRAGEWSAALGVRDYARQHMLAHCSEPDLAHESNVVDATLEKL
jgi:1-acyl-sn-glycerol-3-phosphate acyltransferase